MLRYYRSFAAVTAALIVFLGVCWSPGLSAASAAGGQSQTPSSFNSGATRTPEDPAAVAHGKTLYGINCQACHGSDLRGGDMGGPNLLRSQVALTDQHGELIVPIIQGFAGGTGMPNLGLNNEDAGGGCGVYPICDRHDRQTRGTSGSEKALNILVGDSSRGQVYFGEHCASCHSVAGDLKGIASTYSEPSQLQARWIAGGAGNARASAASKATVDVTAPSGHKVSGELIHIDDFIVTLKLSDGTERTFLRKGAVPVVVVHDPMQTHREMLPRYSDHDIHDLTAYLVTLK